MFDHIDEMIAWNCPTCCVKVVGMTAAYVHGSICSPSEMRPLLDSVRRHMKEHFSPELASNIVFAIDAAVKNWTEMAEMSASSPTTSL